MPSVSPLRVGHLLVLPRTHVTSCAQVNPTLLDQLPGIVAELTARLAGAHRQMLLFEHGVGACRDGGCGVTHAHLHLVPVTTAELASCISRFAYEAPGRTPGSLAQCLAKPSRNDTYMLMGTCEHARLAARDHVPSQRLRRLVAGVIGSGAEDWRQLVDWRGFEATRDLLATA
jgi:diadenosine tetraphosphate (Ap4A) HIT family hydrolase